MTELRKATLDDLADIAGFAIDGMRIELYPSVRLSRPKVEAVIRHCISSPGEFQLAAFNARGQVVGAVAAIVAEMLFFERCEAHVILCRATEPGVGRRLLAALRAWADQDMRIRRVVWPHEFHADARMARFAARLGFATVSSVCTYNKE